MDFGHLTAFGDDFVLQHLNEPAPAAFKNGTVESSFLTHIRARLLSRSTSALRHVLDLQPLNNHRAVVLGVVMTLAMQNRFALATCRSVQSGDDGSRLLLILGSLLPARHRSLRTRELFADVLERTQARNNTAVRVGNQIDDASIDGNGSFDAANRVKQLYFNDYRREPRVTVPNQCACPDLTTRFSVDHCANCAKLRKYYKSITSCTFDAKPLWRNHGCTIQAFAFPVRHTAESLEAALPCLVELDEQLSTDVARYICKPRQLGTQISQFLHLAECRRIFSIAF